MKGFIVMTELLIEDIKKIIPHRYPFLMVDRVVEISDDGGVGIKNVTANEEFFNGHFPNAPTFPGVLMVEAAAQTAVLVGSQSTTDAQEGQIVLLVGVDDAKFKRQVVPGDQLRIRVKKVSSRGPFEKWSAEATVDGSLAMSCVLSAMRTDRK